MLESLGEPHCWVVPGRDTANDYGFIDAKCCQDGELSRPLWPLESIATALAEARAAGRRQGLEEATSKIKHHARAMRMAGIPCEINDIRANAVMTVALALEVLATTPPETQTPQATEQDDASL